MKELKEFTVERLEKLSGYDCAGAEEVCALAKIAPAAKQGEVAIIPDEKPDTDGLLADGWNACRETMLYTTPPLNHTEQHMVKLLRDLVDLVWSEAKESEEVPSTKWADEMIAKVYPVAAPKPEIKS